MNKEKLISLEKYMSGLNDRLSAPVPTKHKDNPETFKAFLRNEIRLVKSKLDAAKLEGVVEKK